MKVVLLGCGTSVGVPSLGPAGWGACDASNPRNWRQRCALLVEKDGFVLLVDAGPDIRNQLHSAGVRRLDAVLITHCHADHIAGMDDLRPYFFVDNRKIPIYATEADLAILQSRFNYLFAKHPHSPTYFEPSLEARTITAGSRITLGGLDIRVLLQHHGRLTSLGFVFDGRVGYSTDAVGFPAETFAHLDGLEVWIVEMLREAPHQAHAHFALTMEWIARCRPKRAILTHLGLESDYAAIAAKCPPGVEPGYDGLTIEL